MLPTSWIPVAGQPSASRLSRASGEWMNRSWENWSATIRLISSGIVRSNERRPASTWPIGMRSLAAVSAAASVEFTSPGTSTTSGSASSSTGSSRSMTAAVCCACDPEPTPSE